MLRTGVPGSSMQQLTYNRIVTACLVVAVGSALAYEPAGEYKWFAAGAAAVAALAALTLHLAHHLMAPSEKSKVRGTLQNSPVAVRESGDHTSLTPEELLAGGREAQPGQIPSTVGYPRELWENVLVSTVRSMEYKVEISREIEILVSKFTDIVPGETGPRSQLFFIEPKVVSRRNVKRKYSHSSIVIETAKGPLSRGSRYLVVYGGVGSAKSSGWSKLSRYKRRAAESPEWLDNLSDEAVRVRRSAAKSLN